MTASLTTEPGQTWRCLMQNLRRKPPVATLSLFSQACVSRAGVCLISLLDGIAVPVTCLPLQMFLASPAVND